ncbi:hypothetical protein JKF63_05952 [Porcisia hertigi]|uniref:TRUD domain-containing protein n=1 Tax=Porcisia hertigi TaxID=2761500 RepID=A0A836LC38_9TRYP|nr:hypothetical protein JKF63_05952 [Porcisia hertigi]
MHSSRWSLRRLILGLSLEDAQSKFDTPESRRILRVAHERYNQGIYHELQVAQRQRNGLAPERKCHISRFTKPSVPGFQAYLKGSPDDYVIREMWDDDDPVLEESRAARTKDEAGLSHSSAMTTLGSMSPKIKREQDAFRTSKALILKTLASTLQLIMENVLSEFRGRRQSGALLSKEHQSSVVNRLIGEVTESSSKSYKSLSSSSHLLEPVEMAVTLFGRKDTAEMQAFKSGTFTVPAPEGDISYSLWIAGGIVASEELTEEFPFHIAKFVAPDRTSSSSSSQRLPHVEVKIYFSSELFQLEKTIGRNGVRMLRSFIGRAMMQQHEPIPTSTTLLLAASGEEERDLYNIYDFSRDRGEVRIPWIRKIMTKVSTVTGVVFSAEDSDENPSVDRMRASVSSVWRAWGHLVKDLHVHGDLDYLYVSISRQQEWEGNEAYISELKKLEAARNAEVSAGPLVATASVARTLNFSSPAAFAAAGVVGKARRQYLPIPADFVVVECTLERKGLPHNMVVEDIVSTLADMQQEQMEMQRLGALDALAAQMEESETKSGSSITQAPDRITPLLYEPKVVVSHAGTLENGTHSFQRIRIRGSCRAHVEALAAALRDEAGSYFTDRSLPSSTASATPPARGDQRDQAMTWSLPKNLSFRTVNAPTTQERLIGHNAPSASAVGDKIGEPTSCSRHSRSQTLTLATDSFAVVTDDERQFWKENYYRLSDIKVIYHDRVDAADALSQSSKSLPPRINEHLALLNRRLAPGDGEAGSEATAANWNHNGEDGSTASGRRKRKKSGKKKMKRAANAKAETAAAAATPGLAPEKLFEYLCTDMEAESARHDLRAGDCMGYEYLLNLRRIPDKHLPLVTPAVTSVVSKGFINYYGPQRFATYTRMNMHPGLHLLKGEYKAAAHILVQQFYIDAALGAERRRTGQAFPRMQALQGYGGVRLPDLLRSGTRRSVAEHGTPMHQVLYNALQASALLEDDDNLVNGHGLGNREPEWCALVAAPARGRGEGRSRASGAAVGLHKDTASIDAALSGGIEDPCAEAFLRVIGPRACAMLIQEFLSFVWNDIVNQRLQRYGTFTLLPGDIVRAGGVTAAVSHESHSEDGAMGSPFVYASRGEIERGVFSVWDLALPLPGADIRLPQNHTEDLYVVTLQRYGLPFDPESRQWRCFKPSPLTRHGWGPANVKASADVVSSSGAPLSPYYNLTSTFALMEEELGSRTLSTEALHVRGESQGGLFGAGNASLQAEPGLDGIDMRPDLRACSGNPLGLTICASYRHALVRPNTDTMQWRLLKGIVGDPYQRWGQSTQAQIRALDTVQLARTSLAADAEPAWISPSTSGAVTLASGRAAPPLLNVESGMSVEDEEAVDRPSGGAAGGKSRRVAPIGTEAPRRNDSSRGAGRLTTVASRTAASYRHQRRWNGTSKLLLAPSSVGNSLVSSSETKQQLARRRRTPPAPSWLPRHHGSVLQLRLRLPTGVYPGMLVRELLKMDVNTPDVVDLDRAASSSSRIDRRASSWHDLTADQKATYQKWIAKRRQQRRFVQQPRAIGLALLHQQIFRSSGLRQSLLPTLRSYDSVSK